MPELPEVETTRRGLEPWLVGRRVESVIVREPRLRWPVPSRLARDLVGRHLGPIRRRAKFLLLGAEGGTVLVHLGMSGSLRIVAAAQPPAAHDHVDFRLDDGRALRLRDPRRFGCVLWTRRDPLRHRLLSGLGPEPFDSDFGGAWLHARARGRRCAVKTFIMNGRVVAGVGNIYANEALYLAGIHPARSSGRIAGERYESLARAIRAVLGEAIRAGGTTLRDYVGGDGAPGEFRIRLRVYGGEGNCVRCGAALRHAVIGQRSTWYCVRCQR